MEFDPAKWRQTRGGWQRVPPVACPRCRATWSVDGARRPRELSIVCMCPAGLRHTTWGCRACGALAAEGCVDATLWSSGTVPVDVTDELRIAIP